VRFEKRSIKLTWLQLFNIHEHYQKCIFFKNLYFTF